MTAHASGYGLSIKTMFGAMILWWRELLMAELFGY